MRLMLYGDHGRMTTASSVQVVTHIYMIQSIVMPTTILHYCRSNNIYNRSRVIKYNKLQTMPPSNQKLIVCIDNDSNDAYNNVVKMDRRSNCEEENSL